MLPALAALLEGFIVISMSGKPDFGMSDTTASAPRQKTVATSFCAKITGPWNDIQKLENTKGSDLSTLPFPEENQAKIKSRFTEHSGISPYVQPWCIINFRASDRQVGASCQTFTLELRWSPSPSEYVKYPVRYHQLKER